jgi:hypothetical protein
MGDKFEKVDLEYITTHSNEVLLTGFIAADLKGKPRVLLHEQSSSFYLLPLS